MPISSVFDQFRKVFGLRVETRAPVDEVPAWATPQVRHGVFASGELAGGGAFEPHELQALEVLPERKGTPARTTLNLHFIAGAGLPELKRMLADGRFRVSVPEESALLAAAWLTRQGETERSSSLISLLAPYFDRLRFYPAPHAQPLPTGSGVSLRTVGESVASLRSKRPQIQVERMRESLAIWTPLYDRTVAMFMETVEGEPPSLQRTPAGIPARGPRNALIVIGGWPCRRYPPDWRERARMLLDEYRTLRGRHRLCKKPDDPKENFARLRKYMATCTEDPKRITEGDVRAIRTILATIVARHGDPDSVRRLATRTKQKHVAAKATHQALADTLSRRLDQHPRDAGLATLDALLAPLSENRPLPPALLRKALRCLEAPLPTLAERGVLTSSEALATVVPWISARTRAAGIVDPELRRVLEAAYLAFRRRRSLLPDSEQKIQFGELPWIAAIEPWIGSDEATRTTARTSLQQVARVAIATFPEHMLPNKLVHELRALSSSAGMELPLVDELAADEFTNEFPENFLRAAQLAGRMLRGGLYERYYGLPYERVLALDDIENSAAGTRISPGFAALCAELAGIPPQTERSVTHNGTIIEQAQILTSHNLAGLIQQLELARSLDLPKLAQQTFSWLCRRQRQRQSHWRAQVHMLRTTGYAWRQLIFYLGLLDTKQLAAFMAFADQQMQRQKPELRARFEPAMAGLRAVMGGASFDAAGLHEASGGRRFLAWTVRSHWLLGRASRHSGWPRAAQK
ncbi:MAG TPA: hypothetical protein VJV78_25055 [Polyangiales bacterium]|nr:hypothetical protein [Polyangiales bacterium]